MVNHSETMFTECSIHLVVSQNRGTLVIIHFRLGFSIPTIQLFGPLPAAQGIQGAQLLCRDLVMEPLAMDSAPGCHWSGRVVPQCVV